MDKEVDAEGVNVYPRKAELMLPPAVYSKQLHTLLLNRTSGAAYNQASNTKGSGPRAWQQLAKSHALVTPQMRRHMLTQILQPRPANKFDDIVAVEEAWEKMVRVHHETAKQRVPD